MACCRVHSSSRVRVTSGGRSARHTQVWGAHHLPDRESVGFCHLHCCVPQDRPAHGISKDSYMQAVLAGLEAYKTAAAAAAGAQEASRGPPSQAAAAAAAGPAAAAAQQQARPRTSCSITVKFLLSIDRRNGTAAAMDTVSTGYLAPGPLYAQRLECQGNKAPAHLTVQATPIHQAPCQPCAGCQAGRVSLANVGPSLLPASFGCCRCASP